MKKLIHFEETILKNFLYSFTTNLQYDNASKGIGLNNRLRWIITPGSDLFLVYNHNWLEDPLGRFETINQAGIVKLSYTHRF